MFSCQRLWFLLIIAVFLKNPHCWAKPVAKAFVDPTAEEASITDLSKLKLIKDDAIHDKVEKDIKKVIRVQPLNLPALKEDLEVLNMDSSLYKIQTLKPVNVKRKYTTMQRSKPINKVENNTVSKAPSVKRLFLLPNPEKFYKPKHQPKKNKLHFLYNQEDLTGNLLSKSMAVHMAPGAYPVYYVVAKTNGRFGKHPLKSFASPQAFMKYLQKTKLEKLPVLETYRKGV